MGVLALTATERASARAWKDAEGDLRYGKGIRHIPASWFKYDPMVLTDRWYDHLGVIFGTMDEEKALTAKYYANKHRRETGHWKENTFSLDREKTFP